MATTYRHREGTSLERRREVAASLAYQARLYGFDTFTARVFAPAGKRRRAAVVVSRDREGKRGEVRLWEGEHGMELVSAALPVYFCVYCDRHHCRNPRLEPGAPECTEARFVRGVVLHFHVLRQAEGLAPWNAQTFARWARGPISAATRDAAAFVLHVWSGGRSGPWRGLTFDAVAAISRWDEGNRAAFLRWCSNPWWP